MLVFSVIATLFGQSAGAAPKPGLFAQAVIAHPAFDAERVPDRAVDHEIVKEITPFWGPPRTERHFLIRSGSRYREGRVDQINRVFSYIDLASRTHISATLNGEGKYQYLSIDRPERVGTFSIYRREKTGERDTVLGEACDVWATTRVAKDDLIPPSIFLTCLTPDGIEMWTRIKRKDEIEPYSQTVSLKRRKVALAEVVPSRAILNPARWAGLQPGSGTAPGHVVTMKGVKAEGEASTLGRVTRTSGPWEYQHDDLDTGARAWRVVNRETGFDFKAKREADGSLLSLSVYNHGRPIPKASFKETGSSATIVGEPCRWVTESHPGPHDFGKECHAADGAVLHYEAGDSRYGGFDQLTAVSLRRGAIPWSLVMPPPELLSTKRWKIFP